jgi:phosphocarrier protein HPr
MNDFTATISAALTNPIGLHARPSVKLTKLAKTFLADIEVGVAESGPWVDAKSIVKVMAVKAARGTTLHFRARGPDATAALAALHHLVTLNFHGDDPAHAEERPGNPNG